MAPTDYTVVTGNERSDLAEVSGELEVRSWPEFMLHDAVAYEHWSGLYRAFPEFQFGLLETGTGNLMAVGNSVPLAWAGAPGDLPDEGWDWALAQGFKDRAAGRLPKVQCALSITIPPEYRGQGISAQVVRAMKAIGEAHGLHAMIAPVRPSLKCVYPLAPMERYIRWKNDEGLPFDPWIRVHVRLGGEIVRTCPHSMRIVGTVADWERWTQMRFPETGTYIVPGALVSVAIDRSADIGTYVEPNVWIHHAIR